eukprot:gnl/TRDRNA2_/TRDRNA2_197325_c0_seq1.p1 gnl/TRDRNA2_/TRDRNA2_197325_c0~~gnl/TRDRNA2_/TRDRNA2_197325_c0_seq1.p1  ORF type:complete len:447 (-),score=55.94 gnl/TRDRNA2_/TRDRNA2_197325_c0_seq1:48-1388(-)
MSHLGVHLTPSDFGPSRLTPPSNAGLSTLQGLQQKHKSDLRRAGASIALTKSITQSIENRSPRSASKSSSGPAAVPSESLQLTVPLDEAVELSELAMEMRASSSLNMTEESRQTLEQAFRAHSAVCDLNGDGTISVEELINILDRCGLIDETLTADKIRIYFSTWSKGCNVVLATPMPKPQQVATANPSDIEVGYSEFESMLRWGTDLTGSDFKQSSAKVIRVSRRLVDSRSSARARLSLVFRAFCKEQKDHMTIYEFCCLCQRLKVYKSGLFSVGDVYDLFLKSSDYSADLSAINFDGFMNVLVEVGVLLRVTQEEVFGTFASATEILQDNEAMLHKVKFRIKWAASEVDGISWRHFFLSQDFDKSGTITWDEFMTMCRQVLKLKENDDHLKILFQAVDKDHSGELDIAEFLEFIGSTGSGPIVPAAAAPRQSCIAEIGRAQLAL